MPRNLKETSVQRDRHALVRNEAEILKKRDEYLPKHIPHSPVRIVKVVTQPISPSQVTLNTAKANTSTIMVCPVMTTNCVTT